MTVVHIKTLEGNSYLIECEPSDTILKLKQKIFAKSNIPVEDQTIVFAGKKADDLGTLESHLYQKFHTIHLLRRNPTYKIAEPTESVASSSTPVETEYNLQTAIDTIVAAIENTALKADVQHALEYFFKMTRPWPRVFHPDLCKRIAEHENPMHLACAFLSNGVTPDKTDLIAHLSSLPQPLDYSAGAPVTVQVLEAPVPSRQPEKTIKVLAFDVSETLQTSADHNDGGCGQPMMDGDDIIIPDAYSVMVGGRRTADLLKEAQAMGIRIILVTNNGENGDRGDNQVVLRTLDFFRRYGVHIPVEDYKGPLPGIGTKIPRLQEILVQHGITQDEMMFFDDSRAHVESAELEGFRAIRVRTADDLQSGITVALTQNRNERQVAASSSPVSPGSRASAPNFFRPEDKNADTPSGMQKCVIM